MVKNGLVSVIIPTFNRAELLAECLKSVLNQTYDNIEILVIDDGSTDETEIKVLNLSNKICYHKLEKIGNLSFLRNYGIEHSIGEFVAFCDDDDIWHPEKLISQLNSMDNCNICCTNAELIDFYGNSKNEIYFTEFLHNVQIGTIHLLMKNYVITSTVLLKKQILPEVPFDYINYKSTAEDYDLWLRLSLNDNILFVNEPMIGYRIHSNLTHNKDNHPVIFINGIKIINNYKKLISMRDRKYANLGIFKLRKEYMKLHLLRREYLGAIKESIKIFFLFYSPGFVQVMIRKLFYPERYFWK